MRRKLGLRIMAAELAQGEEEIASAMAMAGGDEAMRGRIRAMQQEISESKQALADALQGRHHRRREQTLTQTVQELVQNFDEAKSRCASLQSEVEELREERQSGGPGLREAQRRVLALQQELSRVSRQLAVKQQKEAHLNMLRSAFDVVSSGHADTIATIRQALQMSERAALPTSYGDGPPQAVPGWNARPTPVGARTGGVGAKHSQRRRSRLLPSCEETKVADSGVLAPPPAMTSQIMGAGPFPEGTAPPPSPSPSPFGGRNAGSSAVRPPASSAGAFDESVFDQEDDGSSSDPSRDLELLAAAAKQPAKS